MNAAANTKLTQVANIKPGNTIVSGSQKRIVDRIEEGKKIGKLTMLRIFFCDGTKTTCADTAYMRVAH